MVKQILYLLATMCLVLSKNIQSGFQSDQEGLKERGDYSCNYVYMFNQICTDGTADYPPRLNAEEKPDEPLEYETFDELKSNSTLAQDDYLVSPDGDSYFFVDFAGSLYVFSKDSRKSYFMFAAFDQIRKGVRGFGVDNRPFKVQYLEGKLNIFKKDSKLVKTVHLHEFDSKTVASKSRLTLGDDNILKIKVDNLVVWSSNALRRNQVLKSDQSIYSSNGNFQCSMNEKCQFVVYNRKNYEKVKVYGEEKDSDKCELQASDSSNLSLEIVNADMEIEENFLLTKKGNIEMFICPKNGVPNL